MRDAASEEKYVLHPLVKEGVVERRAYQEAIVAKALEGNTLVILPTGLGKTIIAALVIAHRLSMFKDGVGVVLAPTRPLVSQHAETLRGVLNLPDRYIRVCTGDVTPSERETMWKGKGVVVATPQVVENDVISGRADPSKWVVMVFDEAHRAVGRYPYVFIAEEYMRRTANPLILALTASPGSQKGKVLEICKNLHIVNVEVRSERSPDVTPYIKGIRMEWVNVNLPMEVKGVREVLEEAIQKHLNVLREAGYVQRRKKWRRKDLLEVQERLLRMEEKGEREYECMSSVAAAIRLSYAHEILETQGIRALKKYFDSLEEKLRMRGGRGLKALLEDPLICTIREKIAEMVERQATHPKINTLIDVLKKQLKAKPLSRVIVFTQFRSTVEEILDALKQHDVNAERFVGQSSRGGDPGLTQKMQKEIIDRFRRGEVNVLIATSVAEEGLDVSECDLVVFYDIAPSAIRFVQRKGRTGRRRPGRVVFLITRGTRDEAYYWSVRRREGEMREAIGNLEKEKRKLQRERDQQVTLEEYFAEKEKLTIYADVREGSSPVIQELARMEIEVVLTRLDIGDYIVSDRVGIERKTVDDFLRSIIDQRVFRQLTELSKVYEIPILIIEGEGLYERRGIRPEAIGGALASIALDFKTPVLWTKNAKETAEIIKALARREREAGRRRIRLGVKKPGTIKELQEYLVAALPGVDHVLARRLLQKFRTVERVFTASEKELIEVYGVGEKKAKKIREVLEAEYIKEKDLG
ncbi:MAG: DEAD/DEAH box helicase [Candidatus Freyarchaeota archaeon]